MRENDENETVSDRSDTDLVESARAGDDDAFAELWLRHASAGRTVARSFSTEDPDDVVAEAYARILKAVRDGRGPSAGFRPYLFTTIRNVAAAWGGARRDVPIEDATTIEDPETTEAASMDALDRSLTARAFRSLPQRWQEVLWYSEVEGMSPATVAPLLGLTPNGTAALAYRAREGLRQAWIQAHISASPEGSDCRWTTERLGAYSRGALGKRETARLERHLTECAKCSIVAAEAQNVGSRLTLVLLPLLLGVGGAAAYAASLQRGAAAVAGGAVGGAVAAGGGAGGSVGGGSGASGGHSAGAAGTARAGRSARSGGHGAAFGVGATIVGVAAAAGVVGAVVLGPQLFASTRQEVTAAQPTDAPSAAVPDAPGATGGTTPEPQAPVGSPPPVAPVVPDPAREDAPPVARPVVPAVPAVPAVPTASVPAVVPPVAPPVGPPAVPPAAPVVASTFPSGFETAATSLALTGSGAPGATIAVTGSPVASAARVATSSSSTSSSAVLGSATVAPDGSWSLDADLGGLADGTWDLSVTQTRSGLTSAPASVRIGVDRTALPPVIFSADTGAGDLAARLAPILTGTAEPGATIVVSDHGTAVATVTAGADGAWTSPELIAISPAYSLTARETDVLGNVSAESAPLVGTAIVPTVTALGSPGTVAITVHGLRGSTVQVWADGESTPYTLTLDAAGDASQVYSWTAGDHRIGAVYLSGARHGVLSDVPVTLP
ncbi:sigma-70 family RNA polymerase sigma factor [Leifsonia sp. 1010]|uniref:sigma-70 family RNA polymerase sigma factor n=1 Tax=Leifsonia sp. 1010 TaxID=2817769 RepID=UPI00286BDD53|nr:sigma-70 family RNA polymerase sigma factor [Leifsonia sp. 1010]